MLTNLLTVSSLLPICLLDIIYLNTLHPHMVGGHRKLLSEHLVRSYEQNVQAAHNLHILKLPDTSFHGSHQGTQRFIHCDIASADLINIRRAHIHTNIIAQMLLI